MAKCDLCGNSCDLGSMRTLHQHYQVDGVQDVCKDCTDMVNKEKDRLVAIIQVDVRKFIRARIDAPEPPSNFLEKIKMVFIK